MMFKRAKAFAADNCTIIAGTGSNSTSQTIELSQAAQDAGADALLVVSPYYNKGNAEGLFEHYRRIALCNYNFQKYFQPKINRFSKSVYCIWR